MNSYILHSIGMMSISKGRMFKQQGFLFLSYRKWKIKILFETLSLRSKLTIMNWIATWGVEWYVLNLVSLWAKQNLYQKMYRIKENKSGASWKKKVFQCITNVPNKNWFLQVTPVQVMMCHRFCVMITSISGSYQSKRRPVDLTGNSHTITCTMLANSSHHNLICSLKCRLKALQDGQY